MFKLGCAYRQVEQGNGFKIDNINNVKSEIYVIFKTIQDQCYAHERFEARACMKGGIRHNCENSTNFEDN